MLEVAVLQRIDDGVANPLSLQRRIGLGNGRRTLLHRLVGHQPHLVLRLPAQNAHQTCVAHRRQRMVLHRGVGEQLAADEEMAQIDGAAILREGRAGDGEVGLQLVQQRIRHRADVARVRRVEGGAVLEEDLFRAIGLQPAARGERLRHRVGRRNGARLQRHHHGIGLRGLALRGANGLHRVHAAARERVGEVGGPGEIVGDAAEDHGVQAVRMRTTP